MGLAAVLAPVGSAGGGPSSGIKAYYASLQPLCTGGGFPTTDSCLPGGSSGSSAQLTLTIRNDSTSQNLGSANLDGPLDSSNTPILPIDVSSAAIGPAGVIDPGSTSSELQLRNLNLAPGDSVSVTFDVTTPCSGTGLPWTITAKQSNQYQGSGNDFNSPILSGFTTDIGSSGCKLIWHTEPASTWPDTVMPGTVITGVPFDSTGATVTVWAVPGSCTPTNTSTCVPISSLDTGTVTLQQVAQDTGSPTSNFPLSGRQATLTHGVATFPALTGTDPGSGFQLQATSLGFTSSTLSDPFFLGNGEACTTAGCPTLTTTLDNNTQVDSSASGTAFTFLGVGGFTLPDPVPAGCANYTPLGSAGFQELDGRTDSTGTLTFTYYISKRLIQKKYGNNNGQQFIPLCAGAQRVEIVNGHSVLIPCNEDPAGGWIGKELDSSGSFDGNTKTAVCDPSTGIWWGILGSFQDYTNSDPSKVIDPSTNPTVTGWDSNSTYRYFYVSVPWPWDWRMS